MKPRTFSYLVDAMEEVIGVEDEDREGVVYTSLAKDMARAAELIYDSCLKGQSYSKDETEVTTE